MAKSIADAYPPSVTRPMVIAMAVCMVATTSLAQAQQVDQPSPSAPPEDPCASNQSAVIGAVAGAVVGGLIGSLFGGKKKNTNIAVGAVLGATAGGFIGHNMDSRRCEVSKLSQQYGMPVEITAVHAETDTPDLAASQDSAPERTTDAAFPDNAAKAKSFAGAVGMTIAIQDVGQQFESGSAQLSPKAAEYFGKVADQYSYVKQLPTLKRDAKPADRNDVEALRFKRILLIGHTDDTGNSELNAELSEQRAKAVAEVFRASGVSDSQLFYQGAGETLPIADNNTAEGRARNRRVEIVDLTDEAAFRKYLEQRVPKTVFYRPAPAVAKSAVAGSRPAMLPSQAQTQATGLDRGKNKASGLSIKANQDAVPVRNALAFDFGGEPVRALNADVNVGAIIQDRPGSSVVSSAYASATPMGSCYNDRPRVARGVKALQNQRDVSMTAYMPGLYGTSWTDTVNGHLVAITNVSVYRDGGQPAAQPTVLVYKSYVGGANVKPDFKTVAEVNTYRGDKGLLYRVFMSGPVQCMDVVLPYANTKQALDSRLLYQRQDETFVANFKPHMAK